MKMVSLVCTFHAESGETNVSKLHAILERIQPEVIFLEAPADWRGDGFLLDKINNLESSAVARYIAERLVDLVPVDSPTPKESFFRRVRDFFETVERYSFEYCRLIDSSKERRMREGFSYLNSDDYDDFQADIHNEIIRAIDNRQSAAMKEFYKEWLRVIELRDIEMISNIERYCSENKFSRPVFLVGASHRSSIIYKSSRSTAFNSNDVQWDYSCV